MAAVETPTHISAARSARRRSPADDRQLFRQLRATRDPADRDALVTRFLPLARHLAARYGGGQEPFDDLYQVACLALILAIDRFDPEGGTAFSSYAVPTIAGTLKRHFRDTTWTVRVPRSLQERALSVHRAGHQLAGELGRSPTVSDLARATSMSEQLVVEALHATHARAPLSLDETPPDGTREHRTRADHLAGEEPGYRGAEHRAHLDALAARLTPDQRTVLRLHFQHDLTQREIGQRLGVSEMHVWRLLKGALEQMRSAERAAERHAHHLHRASAA